jgi:hypothetical protein
MRTLLAALLAVSFVACDESPTVTTAPTPVPPPAETVTPVCTAQVTAVNLDVDKAGPYLVINATFASAAAPIEIEIERLDSNNAAESFAVVRTDAEGKARVQVAFNTKYRARGRAEHCEFTAWAEIMVGPPEAMGPPEQFCPAWIFGGIPSFANDTASLEATVSAGTYDIEIYKLYRWFGEEKEQLLKRQQVTTAKCAETFTVTRTVSWHEQKGAIGYKFVINPVDGNIRDSWFKKIYR